VNTRRATLPVELRSYLVAAYQKADVTLLEREFTDALLKEVYLDLAGLTDEPGQGASVMQAAYWMVDGEYQSYETSTLEVEMELNIRRMFGRNKRILLRDKPGEPLFRRVKEAIDLVMQQDVAALTPTRLTEVHARMGSGKELAGFGKQAFGMGDLELLHSPVYQGLDELAAARKRRNVEEAIREFQTVLLLSPTNREARMYLAACLRAPSLRRDREARDIYRELLDENVRDRWVPLAQQALTWSFEWLSSAEEKARWFAVACQQGSNSPSAEFYCQNAAKAAEDVALNRGEGETLVRLAEKRLREAVQSTRRAMDGKGGTSYGGYGMYDFRDAFKGDKAGAARALAHFLPQLQSEFPELAPHLAAQALEFQTDTNTTLIKEYEKQLDWCVRHAREVFQPRQFWSAARFSAYGWLMKKQLYPQAIRTLEGYREVADTKVVKDVKLEERDHVALAYAYMGAERWQDALVIFESFTNKSVVMKGDGPWGRAFDPVLTGKQAAWCREKLGLAAAREPIEQELKKQLVCLHAPSDFLVAEDGLWVAMEDLLMNLSFELATNHVVKLPGAVTVTCLATGDGKVWVGTDGDGLIEYDRASKQCRSLTETDGLLMNYISALHCVKDRLWIGYGGDAGGGLGSLDLRTGKPEAYMQSLAARVAPNGTTIEPPKTPVRRLNSSSPEALWMLVDGERSLRRFQISDGSWEVVPMKWGEPIGNFAMGDGQIFAGVGIAQIEIDVADKPSRSPGTNQSQKQTLILSNEELSHLKENLKTNQTISRTSVGNIPSRGGVLARGLRDQTWRVRGEAAGLPSPPSAIAVAGKQLWAGGESFLASVDLERNQIRKVHAIQARTVDRIEIGGGYVWAKYDKHLHRARVTGAE
jgi:hypothetical protein